MKLKWKILMTALVMVTMLSVIVGAQNYAPGSENDPLVSQKYLESKLAQIKATSGSIYATVEMKKGQFFWGGEGAEVIVRTGTAKAIDNGKDGISDLTEGVDLKSGTVVKNNHLILIPRNDGRGFLAETDCWIMVRGGYTVQ